MTINPRRRSSSGATPVPTIAAAETAPPIDSPPRVMIRLPAIADAAQVVIARQASGAFAAKSVTAPPAFAKPSAAKPTEASDSAAVDGPAAVVPWYGRLYTPRIQKYLPYSMVLVVMIVGVFMIIRNHSHKSKPVAIDPGMSPWINDAASPNRQVGGLSPTGPAWPGPKGLPPGASPTGPVNSPSAYQTPSPASNPTAGATAPPAAGPVLPDNYQSNAMPVPRGPVPAAIPNGAQGAAASQGDSVPPMPARSPAWGNPPASDPGVVQGGSNGSEYRTAAASDPSTIPPGRSPANSGDPGVAQFQGNIARP
jgi:hypothetical protein